MPDKAHRAYFTFAGLHVYGRDYIWIDAVDRFSEMRQHQLIHTHNTQTTSLFNVTAKVLYLSCVHDSKTTCITKKAMQTLMRCMYALQ